MEGGGRLLTPQVPALQMSRSAQHCQAKKNFICVCVRFIMHQRNIISLFMHVSSAVGRMHMHVIIMYLFVVI